MQYLSFDLSDGTDGVVTLEAMAATAPAHHDAVMAEVGSVLSWAWREFPQTHGPVEEGMDWDDDLQLAIEPGGWHAVTLTLTASPRFAAAFTLAFGHTLE